MSSSFLYSTIKAYNGKKPKDSNCTTQVLSYTIFYKQRQVTAGLTEKIMNIFASHNEINLTRWNDIYFVCQIKNIIVQQQSSAKPEGEDIGELN